MRRCAFRCITIIALAFWLSGAANAACLTTLGTDECGRAWDPQVQAIAHRYFDVPTRRNVSRHHPRDHAKPDMK
jgi:hypothetical protein